MVCGIIISFYSSYYNYNQLCLIIQYKNYEYIFEMIDAKYVITRRYEVKCKSIGMK